MSSVDPALKRFEAALSRLEGTIETLFERSGHPVLLKRELAAMVDDRQNLAQQLDDALTREKELQALADEASKALGTAIAEVRAALERQGEGGGKRSDGEG